MATDLNQWAWSTTPADNATADAQINWAENQDAATVNNSARAMMAAIAKMTDVQSGNVTVGGSADAITLSTGQSISTGHQALGFRVCFKAAASNTGAVTVAVDGLSPVAVKRLDGNALLAGDIVTGGLYDIAFDGTNYKLFGTSPSTTAGSSFELTSTEVGAGLAPTITLSRDHAPVEPGGLGTINFDGNNSSSVQVTYAFIDALLIESATDHHYGELRFGVATDGTVVNELRLDGTALTPVTNNGLALGNAAAGWSDAFFASGAVLNFDNGDYTITHFATGATFEGASIFKRNGAGVAGNTVMRVQRSDATSAAGHELVDFYAATGQVGSITLTTVDGVSGSVAYNTSSDGRRKPPEHRRPIDDSGQIIDALNPIRFRWEGNDEDRIGFIAQEVAEILPASVKRGDDDPRKRPGDEGYQGWEMAVGSMEAILVAEIKALRARVAALEAAT